MNNVRYLVIFSIILVIFIGCGSSQKIYQKSDKPNYSNKQESRKNFQDEKRKKAIQRAESIMQEIKSK